jgi:hypothetical protein
MIHFWYQFFEFEKLTPKAKNKRPLNAISISE